MPSPSMSVVRDDSPMNNSSPARPGSGGPRPRRSFTPAQKLVHLAAYEVAIAANAGGAYLRQQGIYSSQITQWRKLRDAGVLEGKQPGGEDRQTHPGAGRDRPASAATGVDGPASGHDGDGVGDHVKNARAVGKSFQELAGRTTADETVKSTYRELTAHGISTRTAAELVGLPRATATRKPRAPRLPAAVAVPANKLSPAERAKILAVVNSPEFVDLPPIQIDAQLLDAGVYPASISTIYRVLGDNSQVKERRALARHPARTIPELVAAKPGEVISRDITKLPGPVKGKYFDAYVMIDIYSRYIVGCAVHAAESAVLAAEMMTETFRLHGTPQVVHADRGTSMTRKTVAALLSDLEITRSHSRPRVSNDNPFSEGWFKTLKYAPVFPERFSPASVTHPPSWPTLSMVTTTIIGILGSA